MVSNVFSVHGLAAVYAGMDVYQASVTSVITDFVVHDIARLSPIFWRRINFLGRYEFQLPEDLIKGASDRFATVVPNGTSEKSYPSL